MRKPLIDEYLLTDNEYKMMNDDSKHRNMHQEMKLKPVRYGHAIRWEYVKCWVPN